MDAKLTAQSCLDKIEAFETAYGEGCREFRIWQDTQGNCITNPYPKESLLSAFWRAGWETEKEICVARIT